MIEYEPLNIRQFENGTWMNFSYLYFCQYLGNAIVIVYQT